MIVINLLYISREGRGSAAETAMMKPAPRRATLTPIQTQTPTAPINPRRRKRRKTRMRRKRRVKVGIHTDVICILRWPFRVFIAPASVVFSLQIKKRRNQRRTPKRKRKKRRSLKTTLLDRGPSTGPALCSWGASPPPFQRLRSLL